MTKRVRPVPIAVLAGTLLVAGGACARDRGISPDLLSICTPQHLDASEASPDASWPGDATVSPFASRHLRQDRFRADLRSALRDTRCKIRSDFENYYSWVTMGDLLIGISAAGVLANTSIDEDFHQWHQDDVRSRGTDHFASFWRTWGVVVWCCVDRGLRENRSALVAFSD